MLVQSQRSTKDGIVEEEKNLPVEFHPLKCSENMFAAVAAAERKGQATWAH